MAEGYGQDPASTGGGSSMPVPALIGGIATVASAGIQAATAGGGDSQSGFTLTPEYELKLLDYFKQNQDSLAADYKKIQTISDAYNKQLDTIRKTISGTIPSDKALKSLTEQNFQLGQHLGMSADDMAKNGFIDAGDRETLNKYQELVSNTGIVEDPQLVQEQKQQRSQLEQDLFRQGASPAIRAQALAQFDQSSKERTFQRSQELKTSQAGLLSGYLSTSTGIRQTGFNQAITTGNLLSGQIGQAREGAGALSGIAGNKAQMGYNALDMGSKLRGEGMQNFQDLGKFLLSERTQQLIGSGAVGPGSIESQVPGANKAIAIPTSRTGINPGSTTFSRMSDANLEGYLRQNNSQETRFTGQTNEGYAQAQQEAARRNAVLSTRS